MKARNSVIVSLTQREAEALSRLLKAGFWDRDISRGLARVERSLVFVKAQQVQMTSQSKMKGEI